MPQLWVIAGPNGSGKTTLARKHLVNRLPVVNPDEIARQTGQPAIGSGRQALAERDRLLANRQSFAVETTFSGHQELALMRDAKAAGYKVNLVFICTESPLASIGRIRSRVQDGGHAVPSADVERRYERSLTNLPEGMALADRSWLLDNSRSRMRLIASIERGQVKSMANNMPRWVRGQKLKVLEQAQGLSR